MAQMLMTYETPEPGLVPNDWTRIVGSKGIIEADHYGEVSLGDADGWRVADEQVAFNFLGDYLDPNRLEGFAAQVQDFAEAIQDGREPVVTGQDGRAAVEIVEAADRSAASHQVGHAAARRLGSRRRDRAALRVVRRARRRGRRRGGAARAVRRSSSSCHRPIAATFADERSSGVWRYRGWLPPSSRSSLGEPTTALVEVRARADRSSPSSRAGCRPGRSRTAGRRDRLVAAGARRPRDRRRLVGECRGVVRRLRGAGRAAPRGCSCRPTPRRPSCSRRGRMARSSCPCRARGRRPARRPDGALEDAGPEVAYGSHLWQPAFLAGTATFAYEVFEQLGRRAPDVVVAPLGGGTLLLGVHLGFGAAAGGGPDRPGAAARRRPERRVRAARSARSGPANPTRSRSTPGRRSPRASGSTARRDRARSWPRSARPDGDIVEVSDDEIRDVAARRCCRAGRLRRADVGRRARRPGAIGDRRRRDGTVVLAMTGHGLKSTGPIGEILGT